MASKDRVALDEESATVLVKVLVLVPLNVSLMHISPTPLSKPENGQLEGASSATLELNWSKSPAKVLMLVVDTPPTMAKPMR